MPPCPTVKRNLRHRRAENHKGQTPNAKEIPTVDSRRRSCCLLPAACYLALGGRRPSSDINHIVFLGAAGRRTRRLGRRREQAVDDDVRHAHDERPEQRRAEAGDVKPVHELADRVEQHRVDQPDAEPHREDDEGQREEQQQGLEHHVEKTQQQHDHHERQPAVTADARQQALGQQDPEGEDQPAQQQVDERVVH